MILLNQNISKRLILEDIKIFHVKVQLIQHVYFSDLKEDKNYSVTFQLNNGYVISIDQIVYFKICSRVL